MLMHFYFCTGVPSCFSGLKREAGWQPSFGKTSQVINASPKLILPGICIRCIFFLANTYSVTKFSWAALWRSRHFTEESFTTWNISQMQPSTWDSRLDIDLRDFFGSFLSNDQVPATLGGKILWADGLLIICACGVQRIWGHRLLVMLATCFWD